MSHMHIYGPSESNAPVALSMSYLGMQVLCPPTLVFHWMAVTFFSLVIHFDFEAFWPNSKYVHKTSSGLFGTILGLGLVKADHSDFRCDTSLRTSPPPPPPAYRLGLEVDQCTPAVSSERFCS